MHIINPLTISCVIVMIFSNLAYAENTHQDHHQHYIEQPSNQAQSISMSSSKHHQREHGGEIYQVTRLDNAWIVDQDGQGEYISQVKSMIGTDENRLYVKANLTKPEHVEEIYTVSAFYSRMLSDFWDAQLGVRYRENRQIKQNSDRFDFAIGFHGLAPYFFESDIYLYLGQNDDVAMSVDFERDILLTQKLITQPYIAVDIVFNDDENYTLHTGIKTRYEINKRIKPFVDLSYGYEKAQAKTLGQWKYGVGVEFLF